MMFEPKIYHIMTDTATKTSLKTIRTHSVSPLFVNGKYAVYSFFCGNMAVGDIVLLDGYRTVKIAIPLITKNCSLYRYMDDIPDQRKNVVEILPSYNNNIDDPSGEGYYTGRLDKSYGELCSIVGYDSWLWFIEVE